MTGKVYLVGAGPGDPELITLKGRNVLSRADAVLYDHLANPALLRHVPPHAERVYVGKKRSEHAFAQEQIVDLMIDRAKQGKTVVRLKGGDPFIFGRGGEEVEALAKAGIPFEVVPGVTAPLGIAACTGVPLTHRDHTSVVTFVTGHDVSGIDWAKVGAAETLVVFMGLQHLEEIVRAIVANGRSAGTPAMAVRWGTRPDQQTVAGTLQELPRLVERSGMLPPATVIIGEVVRLRDRLNWFERRPLFGLQIVVTRAAQQAGELTSRLEHEGANVVELPVIELAPVEDYTDLDERIDRLPTFDWLIFTSTNAVQYFFERLHACGKDARAIRGSVCAIGSATAGELESRGIRPDLMPGSFDSEGVAAAFSGLGLSGTRVLLPRAAAARDVIPESLASMGAEVTTVDVYRNIVPAGAKERVDAFFASGRKPHWITFTSGSTVKNLLALAGEAALKGVRIASIGPATSAAIRKHEFEVDVEAEPSTMDGLVNAIVSAQTSRL